jgi:hypothetical protein
MFNYYHEIKWALSRNDPPFPYLLFFTQLKLGWVTVLINYTNDTSGFLQTTDAVRTCEAIWWLRYWGGN